MQSHKHFKNHFRCFLWSPGCLQVIIYKHQLNLVIDDLKLLVTLRNASLKHSESVKNGEMSLRQPSEVFGVPKSTLHDQIMGKVFWISQWAPSILKWKGRAICILNELCYHWISSIKEGCNEHSSSYSRQKGHHNRL